MAKQIYVWDLFVRIFHWSLVVLFFSAMFVLDDESAAHRYAGYAILGLVVLRIIWGFVGSPYARFSAFPPSLPAALNHLSRLVSGKHEAMSISHNPIGALMIYNLLVALIVICATGIAMRTNQFWGVAWVEDIHELAANYTLFCVALHVLGVIFESRRTKSNLVLAMITGKKGRSVSG